MEAGVRFTNLPHYDTSISILKNAKGAEKVFALMKVLENAHGKDLLFASKEYAEDFKNFVKTWREVTGAGNGYDAYWVFDNDEILGCAGIPKYAAVRLNMEIVCRMAEEISAYSRETHSKDLEFSLAIGSKNGAIIFSYLRNE
ncbi:MAG: hypothetical protein A3H69_05055 [Candidatus Sungbacteria bacterium RIFCSPLOWO2_02_FULL_47_9]|uniref:Uncharacterized protein n=1 Tax=Candidatus Sungbacteria bacterium RIFCSPHIGHO2_01_FULL_47_32 TaxID=1802264 RepID=A0A1G2K7N8_9BACT|nr:MAG: hypothetical protein UX72_C0001G0122 [Parcubacteria group bacterium GW2011_GWA2_47_10]OGZ94438.1 MAG: hypothetical protein A2633_04140 [Candidatus Sungbacteria bacterium RIFCSPHIGHO2_01_FULL_47_32]OGZ98030.1 MAG: hypothetical protein A3D57_02845 [Candidatus Sungbacteria bacterium RIFCSPHIGHO2_02_FULL_46_12]OHA05780.1 MAG: hypothetical protein A3A28_05605 [Candidatus Sungbacteria bacterium RIFCSPLOWO2_01_FULL_47_32]OHA10711.1 MAG: hypothetical protein A3H69_05055 [Candidatus Sungbacteria